MASIVRVEFAQVKGVVAKKRVLVVDGTEHEMEWGSNQLELPAGDYEMSAHLRAPIGNKVGVSKPLAVHVEEGVPVELIYHAVGGKFSKEFRLEIVGQEAPPPPAPAWAWLFVVACVAIPIVALGGAIPGALGAGGAAACFQVAKVHKMSAVSRFVICLAITAGCWGLFALMIASLAK